MINELKNADAAHASFAKSLFESLGPLEWLSKAHLLVRFGLSNRVAIHTLSDDPLTVWMYRIVALIGFLPILAAGFATLVFLMASAGFMMDVASEDGIGFARDNYYAFLYTAIPCLLGAYGLSVIDKISLHRAARKVVGTEYLQSLKRLMSATDKLEVSEDARSALSKAILRYTQADTDFKEQPHQGWWQFVRKQKPDEATLGYRTIKLMGAAGTFLYEVEKTANLAASKTYLKRHQNADKIDVNTLVSDVDAFWVKLIGPRKFRSDLHDIARLVCQDRESGLTLSAGVGLFIAIGMTFVADVVGPSVAIFLPLTWAVATSTLYGLFKRPMTSTYACLSWNRDQATDLIHRMALLLLRDSQGEPLISREFDQKALSCLATISEDGVSPTNEDLYSALSKLTDALIDYRHQTL